MKKYKKLVSLIIEWGLAIPDGDYKTANRKYKSISLIVKKLDSNELATLIDLLLEHPNTAIRYWAYVIAYKNNIRFSMAENGLTELANDITTGPIGLFAKIDLYEINKRRNNLSSCLFIK